MRLFTMNRYAAVTATLALFLAMGGTSYAVGTSIGKNSVGSKQIKAGGVHNSDLGRNAVTSSKVKNNSLTGSDVNESTLSTVPNAGTVGGQSVVKVHYVAVPVAGAKTIFDKGGLKLTASCAATADTTVIATTSKNNASIYAYLNNDSTPTDPTDHELTNGTFTTSTSFDLYNAGTTNVDIVDFVYEAPDGTVASGMLVADEFGVDSCHVSGHITVG